MRGWHGSALCARPSYNPDWWDTAARPEDQRRALAICAHCPVQEDCARAAEQEKPIGVIRAGKSWSRNSITPAIA